MLEEPTRLEKMVGELAGLRMLIRQLIELEADRRGERAAFVAEVRAQALQNLAQWTIGSDTPEGERRIRRCAERMLTNFPGPMM